MTRRSNKTRRREAIMASRLGSRWERLFASALLCAAFAAGGLAQQAGEPQTQGAAATVEAPSSVGPSTAVPTAQVLPQASLDDCLSASLSGAPGLRTAKVSLDTASAQLADAIGSNGLTLGESAGYSYQWPLLGTSSLSSSSSSEVNGNNVTGGLSLSGGPSTDPSTSVTLSVQPGFSTTGGLSTLLERKPSRLRRLSRWAAVGPGQAGEIRLSDRPGDLRRSARGSRLPGKERLLHLARRSEEPDRQGRHRPGRPR